MSRMHPASGPARLPPECRLVTRLLPALPDGAIKPSESRFVQAHVAVCPWCRQEAEAFHGLGELVRQQPVPDAALLEGEQAVAWILEREAAGVQAFGRLGVQGGTPWRPVSWWAYGTAVAILALTVFVVSRLGLPTGSAQRPSWAVARLAGAPTCNSSPVYKSARLGIGQWLETDGVSKAKIDVADIGHIEVQPNTRVRLVETRPDEHRLALDRGAMEARIMAPPRLFFVETPSAVAVDLGCAYTLKVDEAGWGLLHVTLGWVAFEREGRESIVPAGALCQTRPGVGPGTPSFEDAPLALRNALTKIDFEQGGASALEVVLAAARQRDSLTLWHLLPRVAAAERGPVYDRLKALIPPPEPVTREGIMRLDPHLLKLWWEEIENTLWDEVDLDEIEDDW